MFPCFIHGGNSDTMLFVGNLRYELHGQVFETFGAGRSKIRRAECRRVTFPPPRFHS